MYKIALGCDHAGFDLKELIKNNLIENKFEVIDFGTDSNASVDYPDYVHPLALHLQHNDQVLGILICGSANGVAITANKHQHIRAALVWNNEVAALARQHNNANVICIPARFLEPNLALQCIHTFINTSFEGGRHLLRVNKIACV